MPDAFGMPFRTEQSAPRFTDDTCRVFAYLQTIDQLGQKLNLSDIQLIQYAIKYNWSTDKSLWAGCPKAKGTSWLDFANEILWCYPEQGIDKYVRPDPPKSEISGPDGPDESEDYEVWTLQSESHEDTPVQELIAHEVEVSASEDFNATSNAPEEVRVSEILDLTFGHVQLPSEQLDSFVKVIYTEILTPEVIETELTHLGDDGPEIPETSAEDLSEILDIDIGALDHELVLPSSDSTDHLVHAAAFILLLTGYITWSRYHFELSHPKVRTSIPETPETHSPIIPKIYPVHPQFPVIVSSSRHPSHQTQNVQNYHPVYQCFQYPHPSHSQIAFYQYESQRCLYLRKKL
ncbi:uncharacterized protein HD556DRAFT_1537450 [Suillus plorans]|uniref:Uncharacterized protein n=1 Tax=Suillus plorans TaxID=116603 RepID=A0A9P7DF73_9AGAM|nr:uncharacterized protein HD556DRAFT_1537450 [Suillus plorans]KAG1791020.1 hypothetical protein HD556DRAFT_1537450 [Suillus plorans]